MKKYIIILCSLFITFSSMAQTSYYDTQWQTVSELMKKQKSKDAEALIKKIKAKAQKEDNKEQVIKSLILLRQSVAQRDEKDGTNTIQDFEKQITGLKFPEKNIMHSMIASLYHSHYQRNRYKIFKLTEIANPDDLKFPKDIETWTPQLFFNKIQEQYDASLVNTAGLKKYPTTKFPELITKGKNSENLHPTLFDVLAHRAIDYYTRNEIDITKAAYYFKLKDEKAFATASQFSNTTFNTKDDYSTKYIALTYLQLATRFHLQDGKPDALIDLEAKRLQFVANQFDGTNGDELYKKALRALIKKYPSNEATARPMMQLANKLQETDKVEALKIAKSISEKFPNSVEADNAARLEQNILTKSLTLTTEKADVASSNILAKISFKNIDKAYFKIIPVPYANFKKRLSDYRANDKMPKGKSIRNWELDLNNSEWLGDNKHNNHSTELKIGKLPIGTYAIVAGGDRQFSKRNSPVSYVLYQVTDITYAFGNSNKQSTLYVVDRADGKPIPNATVDRFVREYDYKSRKNVTKKVDTKTTDKNGKVAYPNSTKRNKNYSIEINNNNQSLWAENAFNSYRSRTPNDRNQLFIFTDRAIYRPGQTIYFKGIYVKSAGDGKEHNILADQKIEVILKDANYKEVKKQTFTTNKFGSINGTFQAPEGLLNGRFTIYTNKGQKQVRVEEYKRPKFEVKMDSLQKNVKLNDRVEVTGVAKAYAGNTVEGAKVTYIVKRKVRWPYYWCFYYWGAPSSNNEIVVSQGQTVTDENGKFSVTFLADGDENINPRTKPFYDFEVSADVTDINGEVRSGKKSYAISQESLVLSVDIPEKEDFNKFNSIKVSSSNTQGTFTATDVKIELIKLKAPAGLLKKRLWQAPKENLLSESDFKKYFPDYEYKNESNPLFWSEAKTIWRKNIRTEKGKRIYLQKIAPNNGYYLLKATARDKDNNEIIEKKVIRLINTSSLKAQPNEALYSYITKSTAQPNDKTNLSISSTLRNPYIHKTIFRRDQYTEAWDQKTERFSISEKDRGGFSVNYFTVFNNRLYQESVNVAVPWSNKDLDISYETFRDKILPGSKQDWKIKISGDKKEKVSAELLLAMYDASLDAFAKNNWNSIKLYRNNYSRINWNSQAFGTSKQRTLYKRPSNIRNSKYRQYPQLNMFRLNGYGQNYYTARMESNAVGMVQVETAAAAPPRKSRARGQEVVTERKAYPWSDNKNSDAFQGEFSANFRRSAGDTDGDDQEDLDNVQVRTNLSETAFFAPNLETDIDGNILFSFTAPEALTRWNIKALAHSQDLKTAFLEKNLVTQKQLMLTPNHPRFMRENDRMVYSTKVSNLSNKKLKGTARLQIINAKTNEDISGSFNNAYNDLEFEVAAGKNTEVKWDLDIPESFTDPVLIKIVAKAGSFSDGEQKAIPLLLNSMLVTETIPLPVRPNTTKNFRFDKLINSGKSSTLKHHKLTVEYTSNPAWYAVQALPYLTDYPYECSEQTFNRYYANALAQHIANSSPRIQEVFSKWKDSDSAALLSNLEKNQELKSALLQETPWVFEAENETAQKKLIANLFNMNRMSKELKSTLEKLEKLQTSNGGFAWFKGMRDNPYITQYIITGIARLQKLGVADAKSNDKIQGILNKAIPYLDARLVERYNYIKKHGNLKSNNLSYSEIQFLYMRSFYQNKKMNGRTQTAFDYFKGKGKKHWMSYNKYMQGMLAISMNRYSEEATARDIMDALRQNAIHKEEMGMYWKEFNQGSYWWYQAPIEAHSLLMEAFREIPNVDQASDKLSEVDEMRIWLLKQKQTQQWKTTKATADACYALLLGGTDWLAAEPIVTMQLGSKKINLADYKQEAGTGYSKFSIPKEEVKSDMGNISVSVKADKKVGTTWGAVYWQYFEQLDKITEAETPLSLKKQVYKVVQGDRGESLVLVKNNEQLSVGDKVKVRIELRADRRMEFVHMKDMRGACFEPTNVLSNYKYQNGLGYYESTKDASTQFFFDNLNPGTYIFEYPMFATMRGDYSNGITTIQCMYAPEFSSHSEGIRIKVK